MKKSNLVVKDKTQQSLSSTANKVAPTITVIKSSDARASITVGTCHCSS